ncbi:MAG: YeeE/YedE family protein [Flavobacterium piscis]|nr:YeeE/YedE family protein [Flavobacterium piscis]
MGPLIPQNIISEDLNFLFAFLIGVAFGYILEQAGFSSSRKLAGVFYGYDFVVLKVFFTAGITAATGVFFFSYLGWLDMDMVYVNPLYVNSAIVGGVIMGFGFIMGGFCPGTGIVGAVIGKIDAIFFVIGIFIGVFIFGYFFNSFEPVYHANYKGSMFVHDALGMSQPWFLFVLVIVAIAAFIITQKIQDKSTRFKELISNTQSLKATWPAAFIIILAFIAILLPKERVSYLSEISSVKLTEEIRNPKRKLPPERIAYSIIHNLNDIVLVDVRSPQEYSDFHFPGAINVPVNQILKPEFKDIAFVENKKTVFYSNGGQLSEIAWLASARAGKKNIYILAGGLNNFIKVIFGDVPKSEVKDIMELSDRKFIESAKRFFIEGELSKRQIISSKPLSSPETTKKAKGGC